MKVICTRCGGTNIACEAIVNPNTGKIIDYLDESFMHANCGDCKEEVVITDVDRVKKDIDSMFFEFVKKNGKEPEYVECQIVWKDTGDDQRTTIKLSLSINDDDNDNVFYYCNGIESLKLPMFVTMPTIRQQKYIADLGKQRWSQGRCFSLICWKRRY